MDSILQHQNLLHRLSEQSYSAQLRLDLAKSYAQIGYPDLAAGEAYMALLLSDEILDDSGEYHEEALETALLDMAEAGQDEKEVGIWAREHIERVTYALLTKYLLKCTCLRSAAEFCSRGLTKFARDSKLLQQQTAIQDQLRDRLDIKDVSAISLDDYPESGLVRRELYPWNQHEPDRFSSESLVFLNEQLSKVAPKLEVKAVELPDLRTATSQTTIKQLGVFAKDDLQPGETILHEKSLLTATSRLNDTFCDACSISLQDSSLSPVSCPECAETIFCGEECLELATSSYHAALCGMDTTSISKDAPAAEAADALYSLLLLRALAMAVAQDTHPLDLPEVKYIWGDYEATPSSSTPSPTATDVFMSRPQTLPFSFRTNILLPLHMLEKLDVNIFATAQRFAPWVVNTLYAKFRGTASARQGPTGLPEVGAVHALWCLANHSCDPNVAWEWKGGMRFWVRETRVKWKGREDKRPAGVAKGEQILSHYCDVELDVRERREWAAGALGGACCCERCLWEETVTANETTS